MSDFSVITIYEEKIKDILAKEYGVYPKYVHLYHDNYEVCGLSGHAIPATKYRARILIPER